MEAVLYAALFATLTDPFVYVFVTDFKIFVPLPKYFSAELDAAQTTGCGIPVFCCLVVTDKTRDQTD